MNSDFVIVTSDHEVLDPIIEIVGKILEVPKDELPLQVDLRVKVATSFNEYLLSLLTNLDDEEKMMSVVEKLLNTREEDDFWAILEDCLDKERGEIISSYLKHFN